METAIQLYSYNKEFTKGLDHIFNSISDLGIKYVEMCGSYFGNATDFEEQIKYVNDLTGKFGLKIISWHFGIDEFLTVYDKAVQYHKHINNKDIVIPWADTSTEEKTNELIENINFISKKLKSDGLYLSYHNHNHEFQKFNDKYVIDILAEKCPDLYLQPDVYWVTVGGEDPIDFINKYAKRIRTIHLKNGYGENNFDSLDKGIVNVKAVINTALNNGINRFIIENDDPKPDAVTNIKQSILFLKEV